MLVHPHVLVLAWKVLGSKTTHVPRKALIGIFRGEEGCAPTMSFRKIEAYARTN